jgi:hypothetical protein|tara:strand:+ start:315 stop:593 length:279 start_codon:yes stop_codon:yes gene_type:complete
MPKTETKRTYKNTPVNAYGVNKLSTKKSKERMQKLYDMWKSKKPTESEVRKAFYSNNPSKQDMAVLNYPTLDEFVTKKNKALYKSGGKKKSF